MSITYIDAIREAQAKALADDPRVFIYGQDVGSFGGAFKATKNLAEQFPGRVLDAPISEDAIAGFAVGAAIEGMRPIIEVQFADFSTVAFNQIVNQAATLYWRTNVACPLVVRLPCGGTSGGGPFHSQSMEAIYAHYPGLIVMTPATVEDAYSMLLEAVAIDDPVIFCEHKFLYRHLKAEKLPSEALPVGKARIAREGRDLTIVAYSAMVHDALDAATQLATEGWQVEVVDLRSVKPLDTDTVVQKQGNGPKSSTIVVTDPHANDDFEDMPSAGHTTCGLSSTSDHRKIDAPPGSVSFQLKSFTRPSPPKMMLPPWRFFIAA